MIINHGTLGEVQRICDSTMEDWRSVFDVNFFSAVSLVRAAILSLRSSQGRIIFVSSGAATGAYSTWGAYGSSKAALNHFALTLSIEEPLITSIAVRPGVVDTAMQKAIREEHSQKMDPKDAQKFAALHTRRQLLKPEDPGHVIARLVLHGQKDFSGQFHGYVICFDSLK
jgi:NAD(P)-dependent dehydrogenase (short-subunit alcohol dehydrogenase family)